MDLIEIQVSQRLIDAGIPLAVWPHHFAAGVQLQASETCLFDARYCSDGKLWLMSELGDGVSLFDGPVRSEMCVYGSAASPITYSFGFTNQQLELIRQIADWNSAHGREIVPMR